MAVVLGMAMVAMNLPNLAVFLKVPLRTRDDLSMAYTPGVARVCRALLSKARNAGSCVP